MHTPALQFFTVYTRALRNRVNDERRMFRELCHVIAYSTHGNKAYEDIVARYAPPPTPEMLAALEEFSTGPAGPLSGDSAFNSIRGVLGSLKNG